MSWKSIVSAGLLCILASPAWADPVLVVRTLPYSAARGGVAWEVRVQQDGNGALAVELPLTIANHPVITNFTPFLADGGDPTNGPNNGTWYYNETSAGSGVLIWNTQQSAANVTQNIGANPFTGTNTEGLWLDTAARQIFAALGSDVNLPDGDAGLAGKQVNTLRIVSGDGIMNWADAVIAEDGTVYTVSGSRNSIVLRGDMNGSNTLTFADITPFTQMLGAAGGIPAYNAAFPGLNGRARGDFTGEGNTTFADITAFTTCLSGGACGPPLPGIPGAGSGGLAGSVVPEPTSALLVISAAIAAIACGRRRR